MAAVASSVSSPLACALAQRGRLVRADANATQADAKTVGVSFIEQLVQPRRVNAREVASFASATFGVPSLDLDGVDVEQLRTTLIDTKLIGSRRVIPPHKRGNRLYVATSDPTNEESFSALKFATGSMVELIVVEEDKLAVLLKRFGESGAKTLDSMIGDGPAESCGQFEEIDDAPVVKYVQKVLLDAINGGVSDIHFEPHAKFYRSRYSTDDILYDVVQPPLAIKEKIASWIKVISKLGIAEKRVPQDGRMKLRLSASRAIDFRVSTLPTGSGKTVSL
jgi:type IV pilus assembly protein PilB